MKMEFTLDTIDSIAQNIIQKAQAINSSSAIVIALSGDLGAGKTTLSQTISHLLGNTDTIISPTFVIMKKYALRDSRFDTLIHIDAYRLNSSEELSILGWDTILSNPKNLILLEWPERVHKCLDERVCHVKLEHIDENTRSIIFEN